MSNLEQISQKIDDDISKACAGWRLEIDTITKLIEAEQISVREAAAQGDARENSELQIALDKVSRAQMQLKEYSNRVLLFDNYRNEYKPTGFITVGSTVHLRAIDGDDIYIKIVPSELGNARIGAVSKLSSVGSAVLGKCSGDVVTVLANTSTSSYIIEEVY